jgi:hypothetical protein
LSIGKSGKSDQGQGFAQTLSTGSEHRFTVSPRAHSPVDISPNGPDEVEQYKMDPFDSLAVTATNSSRSHTNEAVPTAAIKLQDIGPQLQVPRPTSIPSVQRNSAPLSIRTPSPEDPTQREQVSYKALQRLFSRASHLIKESSELDGIIFVDASLQDIAITQGRRKSAMTPANTPRFGGLPEPAMGGNCNFPISIKLNSSAITPPTELPEYIRQGFRAQVKTPTVKDKAPVCQLLGYSLHTKSRRDDSAPSNRQSNIPQSTLRSLLRRYPYGTVFLFNSDGSLLDDNEVASFTRSSPPNRSRSPTKDKTAFEKEKDQLRAYQLLHICPGARGIVFFPLWDPQRDQVRSFSGFFSVSSSASRMGVEHRIDRNY